MKCIVLICLPILTESLVIGQVNDSSKVLQHDTVSLSKMIRIPIFESLLKEDGKLLNHLFNNLSKDTLPSSSSGLKKTSGDSIPGASFSQFASLRSAKSQVIGKVKGLSGSAEDSVSSLKMPALPNLDSLPIKEGKKLNNMFNNFSKNVLPSSLPNLKKPLTDSISRSLDKQFTPGKPFIAFNNGSINYNYTYRSSLDTPYLENNIQQHLATISTNVVVAQKFPLRVSVFERRSNSIYFRNYTDVRIEFNAPEYHRLQSERLTKYFNSIIGQLQDPKLKAGMEIQQKILANLSDYLNRPEVIKKFLQSKETIINEDELSGTPEHKDSIVRKASAFINLYEQKQKDVKKAEQSYNSLKNKYVVVTKKIQQLQKLYKSNINYPGGSQVIAQSLKEAGLHDRRFERLTNSLYAVRTLAIGKTMPNYTNLTVRNIGVNGINAEFNNKNLYAAVVAGLIDFRTRDFVFSKYQSSRQYVTAARIGWGRKEGNHIIFTGYKGQKQIFSSQVQNNTTSVFGLSVESQFVINKNIRLIAEVAQSSMAPSAGFLIDSSGKGFSLKDNNSKAWSLQLHSYFPHTRTRVDGLYEHQGINFQCFNAYKANASTNAWNLKADQYFLSGILHLTGAIHKNDYANPLIQQNYSSNTIFTTFAATFHKRFWPIVSVGYIPSSQYSIINSQVYESRYQAFNINVNQTYKLSMVNT